jgi:hypothetical protein
MVGNFLYTPVRELQDQAINNSQVFLDSFAAIEKRLRSFVGAL